MTDGTEWCYASGVVAVLEASLLTPRAVAELAEGAAVAAELLAAARRSPAYADAPASADDPLRAAAGLESALVGFVRRFVGQCPDERVADVFLIEYDLRDLSNLLKSEHCGVERRPVELSRLAEEGVDGFLASAPPFARVAEAAAEAGKDGRLHPSAIDLMMDGAFIEMLPGLTESLRSAVVDRWAAARGESAAVLAVVRARASGVDPADIHSHLLGRLAAGSKLAPLADAEPADVGKVVAGLLPAGLGGEFDAAAGAAAVQALAGRLDNELERILDPARYVAFGPERVFRYLWQLFRENRNLRAALGGLAGRIEHGLVVGSMRGADV